MSWNDKVVWSEGMFLQPQHFQQHDRYLERLLEGRAGPLQGNAWGFAHLELDAAALGIGKIQLASARGIFPDGTPFDFPSQDASPAALEVGADIKDELVVLAVPMRRPGSDESGYNTDELENLTRFSIDDTEVHDSNAATQGSALIQVGRLRMRLALKRDTADAYATVGVARISERRADNVVLLDKRYIPPVLDVYADPLLASYIRDIHGLLYQRGEALATQLAHPGRGGVAEIVDYLTLQTINRYEPLLSHLSGPLLVHPERLFSVFLGLAGDLATFSHESRRPAPFPAYEHDDLEFCFRPLMEDLRHAFSMEIEQHAIPIELQERRFGVRVAIIPDLDLFKSASFVFAVNAQMPADALRARFPTQVTVGPAEKIRDLVNLHLPGIPMRPLPVAPRLIPYHAGFNYFELERGGELWKQLERSGGLAMHIAGEFPGLEIEFWGIRG
jgi:type VI secretion system protein ImpJ